MMTHIDEKRNSGKKMATKKVKGKKGECGRLGDQL